MSATSKPRARQACEPCRQASTRKKSRCPGERPVCSFCSRLNQPCTYARPSDDYRIRKSNATDGILTQHHQRDRVDVLESRLNRMEEMMNLFSTGNTGTASSEREDSIVPLTDASPTRPTRNPGNEQERFHPADRTVPSPDTLRSLADVYDTHFNSSAFLLFDTDDLRSNIPKFPTVLLLSSLSILAPFSKHNFFQSDEGDALAYYRNVGRRMVIVAMLTPSRSLELLQAFCCVCYSEIIAGKPALALITLGLAARYAFCTNLLNTNSTKPKSANHENLVRCLWSLYYLDRTYGSSLNTIHVMPHLKDLPELPLNIAKPGMPNSLATEINDNEDEEPLMNIQDVGIVTYVFRLLSIWGDLSSRLRRMRTDSQEKGWEPTSAYQQTRSQVFELECTYPQKHRFDYLRLEDRSGEEMTTNRQYWDPWILSQMLYHGLQALLNHPVLHFFRKQDRQNVRPPSFQQQIIDHSILHSRWIVRLVELCEEKSFRVSDPSVAHIVSTTATVLFFLSFSKDEQVAAKAIENFDRCETFVGNLSQTWPHLVHTKSKLAKLAAILPRSTQALQNTRPRVNEALIWSLLDYAASSSPEDTSRDVNDVVEVDVNTQHLSPLDQRTPRTTQIMSPETAEVIPNFGNIPPEWTQNEFSLDMLEIPDMPGFLLPDEYWTGGQL